ncbi:MAG: metallophosphoesterase family protein, partial [Actinomycetia bacterium]|nr:metallophosphoesterase family protein [Actinomycetes bacterium]
GNAVEAVDWTQKNLGRDEIKFLKSLPESLIIDNFLLAHGAPSDKIKYIFTSHDLSNENRYISENMPGNISVVLFGHTHIPTLYPAANNKKEINIIIGKTYNLKDLAENSVSNMKEVPLKRIKKRTYINPGSIGQPRDGNPDLSFAILDTDDMTIVWKRMGYNIKKVQKAIKAAGLPVTFASRLELGK